MLAAHAEFGSWLLQTIHSPDAGSGYTVIGLERRTMDSLLAFALDHALWGQAQNIIQPLNAYWTSRGLDDEAAAWDDRVISAVAGDAGTSPPLASEAGALWLFATSNRANRDLERNHLDGAERTFRQILAAVRAEPASSSQRRQLATTYQQLGAVAQARGDSGGAEDWYRQALALQEKRRDRFGQASTYHQLGLVAQARGDLDDAEDCYRKSWPSARAPMARGPEPTFSWARSLRNSGIRMTRRAGTASPWPS